MSNTDINQLDNVADKQTLDKKQIEAEEKEVMLKAGEEDKNEGEGPVKAALAGEVTEQGREVKPKFIPIGAIKMPGFFTRNSDKDKREDEGGIEKDIEHEKTLEKTDEDINPKQHLGFLQAFTKFLQPKENG